MGFSGGNLPPGLMFNPNPSRMIYIQPWHLYGNPDSTSQERYLHMTWHSPRFSIGQDGCPELGTERSRLFQMLEAAQFISLTRIDSASKCLLGLWAPARVRDSDLQTSKDNRAMHKWSHFYRYVGWGFPNSSWNFRSRHQGSFIRWGKRGLEEVDALLVLLHRAAAHGPTRSSS